MVPNDLSVCAKTHIPTTAKVTADPLLTNEEDTKKKRKKIPPSVGTGRRDYAG
jgi:hypothetical protein